MNFVLLKKKISGSVWSLDSLSYEEHEDQVSLHLLQDDAEFWTFGHTGSGNLFDVRQDIALIYVW